jgi:GH18 family chitinase
VHRDPVQKIPYAVKGNQWIGFDDLQSIKDKIEFLKSERLGGAMVWSIDTDDFKGLCGHEKYPLLKTISGELNGGMLYFGMKPIFLYHKKMLKYFSHRTRCSDSGNSFDRKSGTKSTDH